MSELDELYQEVILHHSRAPRNVGVAGDANRSAEGYNPLCGDRCSLSARVEEGRIDELRFEGQGCAISTASASLMTEALKGRTIDEARRLMDSFHGLVTGAEIRTNGSETDLGKLAVFGGVRNFPVRVKCAMLAWRTLEAALEQGRETVSTE